MKAFRNIVFWCHLAVGLSAGLVILLMSATGALLTYERQVTAWADSRANAPVRAGAASPLAVEALLETLQETEKGPTAVTMFADAARPAEVAFGRERTVFVDRSAGAVVGEGSRAVRGFFDGVTGLHRWLGASGENRATARAVTGACNLGFLFLVTSGFYLWWPRNRRAAALRNVTLVRRGLRGKARDFNRHNVIGFWMAIPLFVVVLSGVVISYPWAGNLVYQLAGEKPPARRARPGGAARDGAPREAVIVDGLNALWARAERQEPRWKRITLRLPSGRDREAAFTIDAGTGGQPQRKGDLTLVRRTGEVVAWKPFAANTPGRRARAMLRFAHTGEAGGLAGQTLAGLASLGAAFLVWTGFARAWGRLAAGRGRRRSAAAPQREDIPAVLKS
jgi:uncharacterized iron-regulated membrane protein